jgi:hypothetical protein
MCKLASPGLLLNVVRDAEMCITVVAIVKRSTGNKKTVATKSSACPLIKESLK